MNSTSWTAFRIALLVIRWAFWLYRKLGVTDFQVVFCTSVLVLIFGVVGLLSQVSIVSSYLPWLQRLVDAASFWYLLGVVVAVAASTFFVWRLRKIGIVSVDAETASGLDYKGALALVKSGFDFVGIGAAKLTHNTSDFTLAVERANQNSGQIRLILCDPRADAVRRLERIANVDSGSYLLNVQRSFASICHLKNRFPKNIQIHIYRPANEGELITVRLMLINKTICLLSQNVFGNDAKQGKSVPQLHLSAKPWLGSSPTFYMAFERYFEQLWTSGSVEVTEQDFVEIAAIKSYGKTVS